MRNLLLLLLLVFFSSIALFSISSHSFSPENPTDRRILVLLDDLSLKSSHSIFFNSLQSRGFDLDFKLSDDPKLALQRYGQYLYDGLIIFAPTAKRFGGSLDLAQVLDFVDSVSETEGDHTLIAADDLIKSEVILGKEKITAPILFKGIGHSLNLENNLAK